MLAMAMWLPRIFSAVLLFAVRSPRMALALTTDDKGRESIDDHMRSIAAVVESAPCHRPNDRA